MKTDRIMKKTVFLLLLILPFCSSLLWGQAKKPTLMIMPADVYCTKHGYVMTYDNQGMEQTLPDYTKALQNDSDLRLVISKISEMMVERGFPLKSLEGEMKKIQNQGAELEMMTSRSGAGISESPIDMLKSTAKADIILYLDFEVKSEGPKRYMVFNLVGQDAYSSKDVAVAAGAGDPSFSSAPEVLMEEAVLAKIDGFNSQLQSHFDDLFANGREVRIRVQVWDTSPVDLYEEFPYEGDEVELSTFIDDWMYENTKEGRYSFSDGSENFIMFEQVRIPLYDERERPIDTRRFVMELRKVLRREPFDLDSRVYTRGLGEAWLIIGEK
jgi:hypothetical protein